MDDPVGFTVAGLRAGQTVAVRTSWQMSAVAVSSEAVYHADDRGVVAPASQPSLGGTYRGQDPFGLWWSARPAEGEVTRPTGIDDIPTRIAVRSGDEDLVSATIGRRWVGPGVSVTPLDDDGLVGQWFRPAPGGSFPGVMVLGGSSGGVAGADAKAALLASHGVAALAVAYFGTDGRPPGLVDIELEYLRDCLTWLRGQDEVAGDRVGVLGASRGAELALLLSATYPEVACVVAGAPSSVVWGPVGPGALPDSTAWTLDGRPVVPMKHFRPELFAQLYAHDPIRLEASFADALDDPESTRTAEIPVERCSGPVLLVSGRDDAMWPAARMGEAVERRARERGLAQPVCHLSYPDAGHLCASPPGLPLPSRVVHPIDGRCYLLGGTPCGNAAAAGDSWMRTVEFLRLHLHRQR